MKKNLFLALLIANLLIFLCFSCSKSSDNNNAGGGGGGGGTPPTAVSILGMSYSPSSLTVKVGTVVKWTNTDATPHTVTSDNGTTFSSPTISAGGTYQYTTVTTGTFPYHCTIHGITMSGTLIVNP